MCLITIFKQFINGPMPPLHLIISVLRYYCLLRIFFIKLRDKDVRAGNNPKNYTQIFQTLNLQTIDLIFEIGIQKL